MTLRDIIMEVRGWKDAIGQEGQEKPLASRLPSSPLRAEGRRGSELPAGPAAACLAQVQCSVLALNGQ